jgi:hypothetical protein
MRPARSLAAALAAALGGCVTYQYSRVSLHEPIADGDLAALAEEAAELGACLRRLGAPLRVYELGSGVAIAYGWMDASAWGLDVSVSLREFVALQVSYDSAARLMEGAVLFFDGSLRLTRVERGLLADLTAPLGRKRPSVE